MPDVIHAPDLAPASGYSHGMRARGALLAVAGQVAWDAEGRIVGQDFVTQFSAALQNVVAVVRAAGGEAADLIALTIFVTNKSAYLACLRPLGLAYRAVMGRHYPAMTLVEVKGLIEPGAMVEIQGLAVLPERP